MSKPRGLKGIKGSKDSYVHFLCFEVCSVLVRILFHKLVIDIEA